MRNAVDAATLLQKIDAGVLAVLTSWQCSIPTHLFLECYLFKLINTKLVSLDRKSRPELFVLRILKLLAVPYLALPRRYHCLFPTLS